MKELTCAVAVFESLGLVHADFRLPNILSGSKEILKLIDFDSTTTIGSLVERALPPYARAFSTLKLGKIEGRLEITFNVWPQFALGEVFYYMTCGYEPYGNEWFGQDHGPRMVDLLQAMEFPETGDSNIDTIIRKRWFGEYTFIHALNSDVMWLACGGCGETATMMKRAAYGTKRHECEELVKQGI